MKLLVPFAKYHGLGNDFVIVDARELARDRAGFELLADWKNNSCKLAQFLCNRSFGIGADGLILALPLDESFYEGEKLSRSYPVKGKARKVSADFPRRHTGADQAAGDSQAQLNEFFEVVHRLTADYDSVEKCLLAWVYTNSDGSPADMCGNGLRALSLWARNNLDSEAEEFFVGTKYGPIQASFVSENQIRVDFGQPTLESDKIPVSGVKRSSVVNEELSLGQLTINLSAVGMGNPHAVIFDQYEKAVKQAYEQMHNLQSGPELTNRENFFPEELKSVSAKVQASSLFPESVNVEFVNILSDKKVEVLVFERGCGPTLACASGAAAVVVAGVLEKRLAKEVVVSLPGGDLKIDWSDSSNHIYMEGPAREVFSGVVWVESSKIMGKQAEASYS